MSGMLDGITVLELGQVIAGTYGGVILADMGAEVIKVEPLKGDANRNAAIAPWRGESSIHLFMNRNKKSIALDLKSAEGRALFYGLVEQADVVIDNFRPGVMKRLGIDHDTLKERNPDLVTASVTGFGEYGPAKDRPAFDLVIQAFSGHLHVTGEPEGPPSRVGIPLADIAGGLFACVSVLGGLCGRLLHGRGEHADVGMLDSLVSMLSYDALDHLNSGRAVTRQGTAHAHMVPWQALSVKDGHVVIAAREDKFWRRLCDAIGRPDLKDDARTAGNSARVANREFVTSVLEDAFGGRTKDEAMAVLDEYDIPSAPVNDFDGVFSDPQVVARGLVRSYDHPELGPVRYPASPIQYQDWTFPNATAPMIGQHTAEVLADRLGLDDATISGLAERGLIGVWEPQADAEVGARPHGEGVVP
ncbi:MAG: CoA transferase [Streptosporangiales bacterium]|nr:CoA transferase [Streptosporangiales bacterium]